MREKLSSLDIYIATVNSDIDKFNEYANINYEALTERCERCNDMIYNLLKGYLAAGDKYLVSYIRHQKNNYGNRYNIDKYKLMALALNKYKNMCTKEKLLHNSPGE